MSPISMVSSFQNFGEKNRMRSATQPYSTVIKPLLQYGCVALRMRFFSQNFGTIKRILPGSSSPSHREGPGTEVDLCHKPQSRSQSMPVRGLVVGIALAKRAFPVRFRTVDACSLTTIIKSQSILNAGPQEV